MSLSHAIMTALLEDEMSGYDLARAFDSSMGFLLARLAPADLPRTAAPEGERLGIPSRRVAAGSPRPDSLLAHGYGPRGPRRLGARGRPRSSAGEQGRSLHQAVQPVRGQSCLPARALEQRRDAMMQRLFLYERIRRATMMIRMRCPCAARASTSSLLGGHHAGRDVSGLVRRGARSPGPRCSRRRQRYGIMHGEASWPAT
jgi:hypothetical protein